MVAVAASSRPRVRSVRRWSKSLGGEAVDLARSAGLELDDWQQEVLEASLAVGADGRWLHGEVAMVVPRQNGKGAVLEARELAGLFLIGERLIIHSAHQFDTSIEAFRRLCSLVQDTPELHCRVKPRGGYKYAHGSEGIELVTGQRVQFKARTKGGARGFTAETLILDEAMVLPEFAHQAMLPTGSAQHNRQIWYAGSSVDQEIHEHGVVLSRLRERGISGDDKRLAYFEWSLPFDTPGDVPDEVAEDEDAWASANPGYGIRISTENIELEQLSLHPRGFAVERLGVGDWPRTDGMEATPLDYTAWVELKDDESSAVDPICLAFDVSPERTSSIAAAGRRPDGLFHVEVLDHRPGTRWVPERLAELSERHEPAVVVCDGYGPAASVVVRVREAEVPVDTVDAARHTEACGQVVDLVRDRQVRHLGSYELATAVRGARVRPLGDRWAWSRRASSVDISPLVAATLALSAAAGLPVDTSDPVIY